MKKYISCQIYVRRSPIDPSRHAAHASVVIEYAGMKIGFVIMMMTVSVSLQTVRNTSLGMSIMRTGAQPGVFFTFNPAVVAPHHFRFHPASDASPSSTTRCITS